MAEWEAIGKENKEVET